MRAVVPALLFVLCAGGVAATQPRLARVAHEVKERGDDFALPPAEELHIVVLGWDAAVVDLLWADLLVQYGMHFAERRDFSETPRYVDAILELEPTYLPVFQYVDTLLAYRPLLGTEADVRMARGYLERGTRARPSDATVWSEYGQFMAFIAPSFLPNDDDRKTFRKLGAAAIGHAVELGADADRALGAASLLTSAGENHEAVLYLEHAYAFTEHPAMTAIHEAIGRKLAQLQAGAMVKAANAAMQTIEDRREREMPFLPRDRYLVLGPITD
ncbi:MAG: hypothetical protein ACREJ3_08040, partial [Polyangiaceae bacterium]